MYNVRENEGIVKIIVEKKKSAIDGNITVRVYTSDRISDRISLQVKDNQALSMLFN